MANPLSAECGFPVQTVLEYLAGDETLEGVLEEFPFLEKADVQACISFAAKTIQANIPEFQRLAA